ncbi:AAA family ATPase [Micromonospora sp. R77]|uniref:ATP-binding protein n=1 Tax=Micromonospora sp. R77 TaxID=2925836 RepID=UPI001F60FA8A|nr:LuxR family transcriptional regulator [Micromonospora sp. R77]MCI4066228.1 AAA family ATPase [Micromonospora sp. R77]
MARLGPQTNAGHHGERLGHFQQLLEREAASRSLHRMLAGMQAGQPGVAVLHGEPGTGRTALVDAIAATAAHHGMLVCTAHCAEGENEFAFGAVRQMFERLISGDIGAPLAPTGAAALALPVFTANPGAHDLQRPDSLFALMHGLYWLAVNLAATTALLLVIDDAHWLDEPSRQWLEFLVRRITGLPIGVVLTVRDNETGATDVQAIVAAAGCDTSSVLLTPLSADGSRRLVHSTYGDDTHAEFAAACHRATCGNPQLLTALLQDLRARGVPPTQAAAEEIRTVSPASVARSVRRRLTAAGPHALQVALAVVVLGARADLPLVATVTDLHPSLARAVVDRLVQAAILQDGNPLTFTQPILRSAVRQSASAGERSRCHERTAELLHAEGAPVDQVAAHLLHADQLPPWGVEVLRQASGVAVVRGAPELATRYLCRLLPVAMTSVDRTQLLLDLGGLELMLNPTSAIDRLSTVLRTAQDPRHRGRAARLLIHALMIGRQPGDALKVLEEVVGQVAEKDEEFAALLEVDMVAIAMVDERTLPWARDRLDRFARKGATHPKTHSTTAALAAVAATWSCDSREEAVRLARQALAGGLTRQDDGDLIRLFSVGALIQAEEFTLAERYCEQAIGVARSRGWVMFYATALHVRATVYHRRGALAEAAADMREVFELTEPAQWGRMLSRPLTTWLEVLLDQDKTGEANDLLHRHALAGELPATWPSNPLLIARARLHLAQQGIEAALEDLRECERRLRAWRHTNPSACPWRSYAALAMAATGAEVEARRLAAEDVALARRWGGAGSVGLALRVLGTVTEGEAGLPALQQAVTVLTPAQCRLGLVEARLALGRRLREVGRRAEARGSLREAIALAVRCGAPALVRTAQTELLAAGGRPRSVPESDEQLLTPGERRIASMAAAGATNREIAEAHFVTLRTVEIHLTRVYRKLGVTGRSQLRDALGQ